MSKLTGLFVQLSEVIFISRFNKFEIFLLTRFELTFNADCST